MGVGRGGDGVKLKVSNSGDALTTYRPEVLAMFYFAASCVLVVSTVSMSHTYRGILDLLRSMMSYLVQSPCITS
jgi:hypothetical protein